MTKKDDVVAAPKKPLLSAKIRLIESGTEDTINFVKQLQSAGVDYIAIHCRHRIDKHIGDAHWNAGGMIVNALSRDGTNYLPILLNGGIFDRYPSCPKSIRGNTLSCSNGGNWIS